MTLTDGGLIVVKSKCAYLQAFDWGKNKLNVEEFKSRFLIREGTLTKIAHDRIDRPNESELSPVEKMIDVRETSSSPTDMTD